MTLAKRMYVNFMRLSRPLCRRLGILRFLESRNRRWAKHLRSQFAIYDVEDLSSLDLPWWNYKAIDEVESHLGERPNARVFEYGSGASTLWLAKRAAQVISVEHDEAFSQLIRGLTATKPNVHVMAVPPQRATQVSKSIQSERPGFEGLDFSEYVMAIERTEGNFDLIVIDGRARVACLERSLRRLAPGGLVVFDDVRRRRYRRALEIAGSRMRTTFGLTPAHPFPTSTGLLRLAREDK